MRFVLDTTTLSALMRSDPLACRRLLAERPDDVAVPQPVLAEIHYGLARLAKCRRRQTLEDRLLNALARAEWNDDVSRQFGKAKAELEKRGDRVDDFALAIAAHALAHEAVVVTDNLRHFQRIPAVVAESWT